jgi:excisionase family DNA binding protein
VRFRFSSKDIDLLFGNDIMMSEKGKRCICSLFRPLVKERVGLSREQYPLILKVEHVAEILGISRRKAYELMEETTFPLVKIGRAKRVGRDAFFHWIEQKSMREMSL